jgi:pyruvate dehydrogenase E2 component (dihydrolipoamide acetyltransferase)
MAELINMPKLGFDMKEGQLVKWLIKPGDEIKTGQIVAEIESDKATVEVEAYTAGTVLDLLAKEGDWVPIGAPVAVVGAPGEQVDLAALGVAQQAEAQAAPAAPAPQPPAPAAPAPAAPAQAVPVPAAAPAPEKAEAGNGKGLPDGVRASPLARRVAADLGIDLGRVEGSGPQGRIVKADVEAFSAVVGAAPAAPAALREIALPAPQVALGPDDELIETPRMRARIGQRMVEAKLAAPHFYVTTEIDMGRAMSLRAEINRKLEPRGVKVSVNDLIVKAAALALREFPNINSAFNGETIVRRGHINIGIAVAVENGLINVVSKDADKATLSVLAVRHKEMIDRAREGKIKPEDVEGETFAVSNLGPWDVEHFVAIINPPSAAILALGTASRVPVVTEDGKLGIGWRMKATLSADHRVTDGAEAAAFMQTLKQLLEDPIRLLV